MTTYAFSIAPDQYPHSIINTTADDLVLVEAATELEARQQFVSIVGHRWSGVYNLEDKDPQGLLQTYFPGKRVPFSEAVRPGTIQSLQSVAAAVVKRYDPLPADQLIKIQEELGELAAAHVAYSIHDGDDGEAEHEAAREVVDVIMAALTYAETLGLILPWEQKLADIKQRHT